MKHYGTVTNKLDRSLIKKFTVIALRSDECDHLSS